MEEMNNNYNYDSAPSAHRVVSLMANIMNYLNVSCYEGRLTYYHQEARKKLNEIYERVSKTASSAPSLEDCNDFYDNINYLRNVMVTDDPDYHCYMCEFRYLIALYKRTGRPSVEEEEPEQEEITITHYQPTEEELEEYFAQNPEDTQEELLEAEWWENEDLLRLERDEWSDRIRSDNYDD